MNSHLDASTKFCNSCPFSRFGLCPTLMQELSDLLDVKYPRHFSLLNKHYLFYQGKVNHETYILRTGWIMLFRNLENGERQVLRSVLPGEFLGFQPDLQSPSMYSAMALTDCVICVVPNLLELCHLKPELALRLAFLSACDLAHMEMYLTCIAHRNACERISLMALDLYLRLKLRGLNRGYTIPFPLLQQDIADTVGLTTIHVNRTLHSLRQKGLLKIEKHELTILDFDALRSLVGLYFEPMTSCDFAGMSGTESSLTTKLL